ncbi:MAG: Sec-independent protein translocase protein TatB [Pseudomonadota bacterium]
MFDIGFQEIVLIAVVAIFVLGPEKMPGAVRTLALMIGRLKRNFNSLRTEIEKEIGADDIRRTLRNEEIMAKFKNTQAQVQNSISAVKKDVDAFQKNVEAEVQTVSTGGQASTTSASSPAIESTSAPAATPVAAAPAAPAASTSENGAA